MEIRKKIPRGAGGQLCGQHACSKELKTYFVSSFAVALLRVGLTQCFGHQQLSASWLAPFLPFFTVL
jgi:hypothetical protein